MLYSQTFLETPQFLYIFLIWFKNKPNVNILVHELILSTVVPLPTQNCVPKKHSLAGNSLDWSLFYVVNVLRYLKIA